MEKERGISGIEPSFSIKISSCEFADWQGAIKDLGTGYQLEFNDLFELTTILEKWTRKLNPSLSMKNARSWDRDEGSIDKQGETLFRFMRRLKPFEKE